MPKEIKKAFIKTWDTLTRKERKLLTTNLAIQGLFTGGTAVIFGIASANPGVLQTVSPILFPILAFEIGLSQVLFARGKDRAVAKKFARLFKRHRGKSIEKESKRLEKLKAYRKLRKVV